jgi:Uma2 family endonuclease
MGWDMAMATAAKLYTADDLWHMPGDEPWDLWEGELRKVPGSSEEASAIAHWIGGLISLFVQPRRLGVVTGADGTFVFARDPDTVVVPDVAFRRRDHDSERALSRRCVQRPPDFAVEVISPSDGRSDIARKQDIYARAGVPLVWWVEPIRRTVAVQRNGDLVGTVGEGDELNGGEVLPGFRLTVAEIFAEL